MRKTSLSGHVPVVLDTRVVSGSGGAGQDDPQLAAFPRSRPATAISAPTCTRRGCRLRAASPQGGGLQAPLLSVPDRGPWDWRVVSRMLRVCRRERVQIWHGHDYKSNALGLLLRRFWPMRLVTTVHGWVKQTRRTPLYYKIDRLCLPRYESVICVSEDLRDHCLACGVPAGRVVLDRKRHRHRAILPQDERRGSEAAPGHRIRAAGGRGRRPAVAGKGLRPADPGREPTFCGKDLTSSWSSWGRGTSLPLG